MKKFGAIISIICCFALSAMFSIAFASERDTENSLLESLGVTKYKLEYDDADHVSRGDFMTSLVQLMTGEEVSKADAFNKIKIAQLTSALDLSEFDAGRDILVDEAVKMMVCLLGRGDIAQMSGGYPMGYYQVAYDIGLLRRANAISGEKLTNSQLRTAFVNMLEIEVTKSKVSGTAVDYTSSGKTFLEFYRDITKISGVIESNEYTSMYNSTGGNKGTLGINGEYYAIYNNEYNELLGCDSVVYVDDAQTVVFVHAYESENIIKVDTEDIIGMSNDYKNFSITKQNNKTENLKISSTVKVIYNNVFYKDYAVATFKPSTGYVRLIDNNDDEVIDVVDIHDYKVAVVNYISAFDMVVASDYGNADTVIDLENCENAVITKDGINIRINDIVSGNVIRVAQSKDFSVTEIIVSDATVSGIVSSIMDNEVVIGDKVYELANEFNALVALNKQGYTDIVMGVSQTFYLDHFGKIVAAKYKSTSEELYVWAFRMYKDESDFINVKYMDTNGNHNTGTFKNKVKYNNSTGTQTAESVYTYLDGSSFSPQLLKIKFNREGLISEVYTPVAYTGANDPDEFTKRVVSSAKYTSNSSTNYVTNVFTNSNAQEGFVDEDTIVFFVDDNIDDSYVGTRSDFTSGRNYNIELYNLDEYKFTKIVVCETGDSTIDSAGPFLIVDKSTVFDKVEGASGVLHASYNGSMSIQIKLKDISDLERVNPGDLVNFYTDALGNVRYKDTVYSPASGKVYKQITGTGTLQTSGEVESISFGDGVDGRIRFNCNGTKYVCPVLTTVAVDIYDVATNESYHGKLGDIVEGDFFVGTSNAFRLTSIRVYKNIE